MPLPATRSHVRLLLATALMALCLPTPAFAQSTTVTGIEIGIGTGIELTIPTVEVEGSSLGVEAIRAIFTSSPTSTTLQWSDLDAARIFIPEMRLEVEIPGSGALHKTATVYRNIELVEVVDGIAMAASVGSSETSEPGMVATLGRVSSGRLDIGAMAGFYGLRGRPGDTAVRPLYADLVIDGISLVAPGLNCEAGTIRMAEFAARPLKASFEEILPLIQEIETQRAAGGQTDPATVVKVVGFYLDMFTAFRSSPAEFDGFICSGKNDSGDPLEIKSGPITVSGFEPGIYPAVAANNLRLDVDDRGWMEFGNVTLKAMDFSGAIEALKAAATLDDNWFATNWRKLLPAFDGFAAGAFSMDVPDPDSPGRRIQAGIGAFDISLGDYVNGIPAKIGLSATDIQIALPPEQVVLAAHGLDRLDLDYDIALHWDAAASNIVVDRFVVADTTLGSVKVSGTLGNATADLFSEDADMAAAAAAALTIKGLEVEIADEGMTGLLIALAAKDQNQRPVVFRAMLSGLAQALPLAALGPSEEAIALGRELRDFIDGKPNLKLTLTSRDPAGIGLAEFEKAQQDPTVLNGKITIVAEASGERRPTVPSEHAPAPVPEAVPEPEPADEVAPADELSPREVEKLQGKQAALGR